MAKKQDRIALWKDEPDDHDFPAARDFLNLLFPDAVVEALVDELAAAETVRRKAKDLMRASRLPLLPRTDAEVVKDLKRITKGESLSPVLLVRGSGLAGVPLIVADGYHRICTGYHLHEDAEIPCRIAATADRPRAQRRKRPETPEAGG